MKKLKLIFTLIIITLTVSITFGQENPPPNNFDRNDNPQTRNQFIARELNLTKEQKQQWRQINREGRLQAREAQQMLRQSREELDDMIYADNVDEVALEAKLRAVAQAQSKVIKIRAMTEYAVRNILTPQQVTKFRNLRKRFRTQQEKRRLNRQRRQRRRNLDNKRNRGNRPLNRNRRPI